MANKTGGAQHSRQRAGSRARAFGHWWRQTGEPLALGVLVLLLLTLPLLVLLDLLTLRDGVRGLIGLVWLAGMLLLPRLPRLLRQERRRSMVLVWVGVLAVVLLLLAGRSAPLLAEATRELYPQAAPARLQSAPEMTFKSPPRISRDMFAQLLQQGTGGGGTSPAAPEADKLYDILLDYELDPAVALSFFAQESQFCTTGICASHDMHSWGGNRAAFDKSRAVDIVYASSGPFVSYASWEDGLRDWCELILYRYIDRGLDTVEKAVPVYAPAFDGNNPDAYIATVRRRIAVWQGQDPGTITDPAAHTYDNLETALITETFVSNGLEYNSEWAFHQYMVDEARNGRPLGSPLDESRRITVNGQDYVIQAFAFDTLYTPLAPNESDTNWNDVRRLNDLLHPPAPQPTATPLIVPTATPTPVPTPSPEPRGPGTFTVR